jgi:adenine-specific DNA-methyltransferase
MPTPQQLRNRLLKKLKELFQLDQPDLDFGFFKIMHAKSVQVQEFIEKDLLKIVAEAFGQADTVRVDNLRQQYEKEIETAREYGVEHPENSQKVKEAKARWEEAKNTGTGEGDIYDHLYRFFERYYDGGDFLSRRYYARETPGKAAPYAIPYNGEEVKLHWANADQYYIKTAEYFTNFTFDLTQAAEIREMSHDQRVLYGIPDHPVRVHFRIAEASEGEHGNVKAAEASKRYFIIHEDPPVALTPDGELVVYFEYRPDPEKTGQEKTWRDKRNGEAVQTILKALKDQQITQIEHNGVNREIAQSDVTKSASIEDYLRLLGIPAPTEKEKARPLLAKYINKYTARNTMDYFIHKDLGGFLRRELDFYIKNEVMRIDDIENADFPAVETWLAKIRVLRKIAGKLIDFLVQLEDFQKKLWLKKKFVVETNYCITLDRVPQALYPEIAAHEAQHNEWVSLFAIDEIQADTLGNPGYAKPLTIEFLKANDKLVLDTTFFGETFKARLLASIDDFDEQCDGLLVHSENFQALNLLQERYREQVRCIYIDPPYNTGDGDFNYKDSYQHASWLTLLESRIACGGKFQSKDGAFFCNIDDNEFSNLKNLIDTAGLYPRFVANIIWKHTEQSKNDEVNFSRQWNYLTCYGMPSLGKFRLPRTLEDNKNYSNPDNDPRGDWRAGDVRSPNYRRTLCYEIETPSGKRIPPPENGWRWSEQQVNTKIACGEIIFSTDETRIIRKIYLSDQEGRTPENLWIGDRYGTTRSATNDLKSLFGVSPFDTPKPQQLIQRILELFDEENQNGFILDYFAGSGPAGQATINLNREDNGKRKYILVEMADYFDTVLRPRIAKVVYSDKWKDGKPVARNTGVSHCFKYIRLESYEDTLNNLRFDDNPIRDRAITADPSLKEDFMLHYLLDVETRGSQSLLNIDGFSDPTAYTLKVKKPGSDEYVVRPVDMVETFNYLIGLRVVHTAEPQEVTAQFKRVEDPEAPEDQKTRLVVDGKLRQVRNGQRSSEEPVWWFRKVEGWVPSDPSKPDNGKRDKVLIVWRNLTGDMEKDNAVLDEWFQKNRASPRDMEFDLIYVNGSNNLPNLRLDKENWKVRLIEEEFMKRMWDVEGV